MTFGEKDLEVLQNIEAEIVEAYRRNPAITDFDVTAGLDAVCRRYTSEAAERKAAEVTMDPRAQAVHDGVTRTCGWRLGRLVVGEPIPLPDRSLAEMISSLRTVMKSVRRWSERGGKRGYLDFVKEHLP